MSERISRRTVRRWLEDWEHIVRGGPPQVERPPGPSGPKPADGITNGMLNKIMLEMAYEMLPLELRRVAYYRWVKREDYSLKEVLTILGLTKDQYYYRCDRVVNKVYYFVNGDKDML